MESWGNKRANDVYEANITALGGCKPGETDAVQVVEKFIRDKYIRKMFLAADNTPNGGVSGGGDFSSSQQNFTYSSWP